MKNSFKFFENKECQFYPCHKGMEHINCLFCFCPLYVLNNCPGEFRYIESNNEHVKDCSHCLFPHIPDNYKKIMELLKQIR